MKIEGEAKLIASAFVKARGEMSATVAKDGKGNFGKYATLAAIVEVTTPAFAKHGLVVVQETGMNEHGVTVDTWLVHESGATMDFGTLTLPLADRKPQAVGSAITYGRRYALAAVCGLAPDDDDGQAAQDAQVRPQRAQTQSSASSQNAPPDAMWEPASDTVTAEQLMHIDALGQKYYGAEWLEKRPQLAELFSKGAVKKVSELKIVEADKLIKGLEKKLAEANGTPK